MSWIKGSNKTRSQASLDAAFWAWQMLFCEGYPRRLEIEGEYYE
jgi:hypothetical protein